MDDGQAKRRDPAHRIACFADEMGALAEPLLDGMCACEEIGDGVEGEFGDVETGAVGFILSEEVLVTQLPVDLTTGTHEGDSIDAGHHGLLNGLTTDVIGQLLGNLTDLLVKLLPTGNVLVDLADDHVGHVGVDVAGLLSGAQVDLIGAFCITAQRSVMLQAIAATVLMDVKIGDIVLGRRRAQCTREVDYAADGLPAVLQLQPPALP